MSTKFWLLVIICSGVSAHKRETSGDSRAKRLDSYFSAVPGYKFIRFILSKLVDALFSLNPFLQILVSISFVSFTPVIFLMFIPLQEDRNSFLLHILAGFAAGCILGDAFLHLIPSAYDVHDRNGPDVGVCVLTGIILFYTIEKYLESFGRLKSPPISLTQNLSRDPLRTEVQKSVNTLKVSDIKHCSHICTYSSSTLNILADFVHNFIDGMAIGSSFLVNPTAGFATTLSVFFHEIPHEVSDFAILVRSGIKPSKAMAIQLITAVGAYLGAILVYQVASALSLRDSHIIPSITAGGFIYIACVNIIPSLLKETHSSNFIFEISSVVFGTFFLELIH
ncbi:Histidine-rich membrane protein KE4 2 [Thelohanellus kitauei]|uniref:Histidine-rich membrane protein KE4 2 n=1 Tax=Thelohanellus kitauei TaxID=669202 RepID=A0A0C2IRD9_THEKT|nr:Histidine-rich membrane protein KE4 2 [Thelohanellus kitauei]